MRRVIPAVTGALVALLPAAVLAAEEGGEAPGGSALITPSPGLFIWTVITFAILLLLLWKTAWKPLLNAVETRERGIRDAQDNARKDREQAAAMLAEQRDLVAQARRERAEALAAGQRDAERLKAEILDEARRQKEELLKQADDSKVQAEMDKAMGYYAPAATVVDDLPPYRWTGPGAGGAWLTAMGANAQKLGISGIEMRVAQVTRVDVAADHAYAVAPGRLSLTYKDGHVERAEGQLAFTLTRTPGGWKIDTQTWTGPTPG